MEKDSNKAFPKPPLGPSSSLSSLNKNARRSARVFLHLPVQIFAISNNGEKFLAQGHTVDVSHDGAAIQLDCELLIGQTIKIKRVGADKEAAAQVVGYHSFRHNGSTTRVFGIAWIEKNADIWGIAFPAEEGLENAVLRALLRCLACGRLEVAYLNEFDSGPFLNHHSVARLCGGCGGWTTWTRPDGYIPAGTDGAMKLDDQHPSSQRRNQRSHERVHSETVGCIRHPILGNEVVLVSSLARGGLTFYSSNQYQAEARLEVAVPYTSRAPNIYSLIRVVGSRKDREGDLTEYRATYLV